MATKWKASPEVRARAKQEALAELAEFERAGVGALRAARNLTQVAVAEQMHIPQSAVSRLESQANRHVSTLRRYVDALGGRLELRAVFSDDEMEFDALVARGTGRR